MEDKNLQKKDEGAIVPRASGEKGSPAGFDGMDKDDLKMPRLAILQVTSKMTIEGKGKLGQLGNSLTKELYGDSVEFIPLFMFKSRAQFVMGKGLVMMSRDNETVTMGLEEFEQYVGRPVAEVPGSEWDGQNPPTFNLVYNFPVLIVGRLREFPVSLSLMKTATKAAKELCSMARFSGEDMFARVYSVKTKIESNDKGTFAVPVIEFVRRATDEEYAVASQVYNDWYRVKRNIAVDLEQESAAETA